MEENVWDFILQKYAKNLFLNIFGQYVKYWLTFNEVDAMLRHPVTSGVD